MAYLEPESLIECIKLGFIPSKSHKSLVDKNGLEIQVSLLCEKVWSIEVRYDSQIDKLRRQAFTGRQNDLEGVELSTVEDDTRVHFKYKDESMFVESTTGMFQLSHLGNTYFNSALVPFLIHEKPQTIYEGLESREVSDFSSRAPFSPKGVTFESYMVRFQFPRPSGFVFGLPGQCGEINRNGYRFELYNTDQIHHTPSRSPMYQSWPILFYKDECTGDFVGMFHDNPSRTFVDLGVFYEDLITFESVTGNSRLYITRGKTLAEAARNLNSLFNPMSLPPLWAFGYQQCRWSYMSTEEVRSVVERLDREDFPVDAIYFDIDYMEKFKVFTNNTKNFSDLDLCISELKKKDIRTVCIIDPGVKIEDQYSPCLKLKESGAVLRSAPDEEYIGVVWPGEVLFPDFSHSPTRQLWGELQSQWLGKFPFDGVWNDMNEPSNFRGANEEISKTFTSTGPMRDEYNLYGFYMSQASCEGLQTYRPEERPFVITRSGYPGVQQYAVIWHGDNSAWWEHIRLMIDTCIGYSVCGAYYTGADVPGFFNNAPDDLAVRFFQAASFLPLFRGHSWYFSKHKEPYVYCEKAKSIIRQTLKQRYSLLREWYSGFELSVRTRVSPVLPVVYQGKSIVRDQFLLFDKFLVAPVVERDQLRRCLYLPPGNWYRLNQPIEMIEGDTWMTIDVSLEDLPVFVRAGSIVVRNKVSRRTTSTLNGPEAFDIYPGVDGKATGYYYSDDGVSQNGKSERFLLKKGNDAILREEIRTTGKGNY